MTFKSGYIAILGAPNAGKSTLLNVILHEKLVAVTDKPQTTRKRFIGIHSTETCQMIFLDTPGIHTPDKKLNFSMMNEVDQAIEDADVLCFIVAFDRPFPSLVQQYFERTIKKYPDKKIVLAMNKVDIPGRQHFVSPGELQAIFKDIPFTAMSSKMGENVDHLLSLLEDNLPEGEPFYPTDQITTQNLRDIAAEIIREKVTENTYDEIPYGIAVQIEKFQEKENLTRIIANIIVDQDSQKGIVIGKKGVMIKEIGIQARQDLEELCQTRVYLEVKVRVDKNWTKNSAKVKLYQNT